MDGGGKHRPDSAYRVGAETAGRSLDSTGKQQKCRMKTGRFMPCPKYPRRVAETLREHASYKLREGGEFVSGVFRPLAAPHADSDVRTFTLHRVS
jgi:hypothetical protein